MRLAYPRLHTCVFCATLALGLGGCADDGSNSTSAGTSASDSAEDGPGDSSGGSTTGVDDASGEDGHSDGPSTTDPDTASDGPGTTDTSEESGTGGSTDSGETGGPVIDCNNGIFPDFDKSCASPADCIVVVHTTDCCGNGVVWGLNASEQDAFDEAEAICDSQYPGCGCPAMPPVAEDGNSTWDIDTIAVDCVQNECWSYVP